MAVAVVVLVLAVWDFFDAHFVVVFNVALVAFHHAALCTRRTLDPAVGDFRTAGVVCDLGVLSLAVQARARALLVDAVVDRGDTDVFVLGEVLAVVAVQTLAVTVVLVAVGYFGHAGAVAGQREPGLASRALAEVAVATLVGGCGHAGQRVARALRLGLGQRDAVLLLVVGLALLALEALLRVALVCGHKAVLELRGAEVRRPAVLALRDWVCFFDAHVRVSLDSFVVLISEQLPLDHFPLALLAWLTACSQDRAVGGAVVLRGDVQVAVFELDGAFLLVIGPQLVVAAVQGPGDQRVVVYDSACYVDDLVGRQEHNATVLHECEPLRILFVVAFDDFHFACSVVVVEYQFLALLFVLRSSH